jgi:hypothetical protein
VDSKYDKVGLILYEKNRTMSNGMFKGKMHCNFPHRKKSDFLVEYCIISILINFSFETSCFCLNFRIKGGKYDWVVPLVPT